MDVKKGKSEHIVVLIRVTNGFNSYKFAYIKYLLYSGQIFCDSIDHYSYNSGCLSARIGRRVKMLYSTTRQYHHVFI